jgi:hypothetical protein
MPLYFIHNLIITNTYYAFPTGRCLPVLCVHLFHIYGLISYFKLDAAKAWKLFSLIEEGYHSTNPYHNSVHAADVTQAMHCFLQQKQVSFGYSFFPPFTPLNDTSMSLLYSLPGTYKSGPNNKTSSHADGVLHKSLSSLYGMTGAGAKFNVDRSVMVSWWCNQP